MSQQLPGPLKRFVRWLRNTALIDVLWSKCPSGLPHRVRVSVVTNEKGHQFCWHSDCFKANADDFRLDPCRCPECWNEIVPEDDDARLCIKCGGRNRRIAWLTLDERRDRVTKQNYVASAGSPHNAVHADNTATEPKANQEVGK